MCIPHGEQSMVGGGGKSTTYAPEPSQDEDYGLGETIHLCTNAYNEHRIE